MLLRLKMCQSDMILSETTPREIRRIQTSLEERELVGLVQTTDLASSQDMVDKMQLSLMRINLRIMMIKKN
jgi:hypothetical protein